VHSTKRHRLLTDILFSVDCEFSGPIPGPNYMMSLGSVAFSLDRGVLEKFAVNFVPLPGASMDPKTKRFWDRNPDAYEATRHNQVDPPEAMKQYNAHIMSVLQKHAEQAQAPVFIEYPGAADFMWVFWYFHRFVGACPFSHSSFGLKTAASVILREPFRRSTKANMPRSWFNTNLKHTHLALDDALGQADLAVRMLCEHFGFPLPPMPNSL